MAGLSNTTTCQKTEYSERGSIPIDILIAAGIAGASSMALEIIWSRLGALLIGGSVYAFAVVLAVFLLGIAIGANLSKKMSKENLPMALRSIGFLATVGCIAWRWLPHGLALSWGWFGDGSQCTDRCNIVGSSHGWCTCSFRSGLWSLSSTQQSNLSKATGNILTSNTVGGVIGVFFTGTYLLPFFGILLYDNIYIKYLCSICLYLQPKEWHWGLMYTLLFLCLPSYDIAIYATGLYNRIGDQMYHLEPLRNLHMKAGMPDFIKMAKVHLLLWDNPKEHKIYGSPLMAR